MNAVDSQQTATIEHSNAEMATSRRLQSVRDEARGLIAAQKSRVRELETALREYANALAESLREQEQALAEERQRLVTEQQSPGESRSQADAEQLLKEAREGLTGALASQNQLRDELTETRRQLAEKSAEFEELKNPAARPDSGNDLAELMAEVERLENDRTELLARLDQVHEDPAPLKQQLEATVSELRELKEENERLRSAATRLRSDTESTGPACDGFDWESQKQALLQQMESDFDEADEEQADSKLTVEGAIRITDQVVAEKDEEIRELQRLLANQSSSLGDMAVGAAAIGEVLDHDDLIREERENLKALKEEWREKLREAEVEISVERAKFARDRAELDEALRGLENEKAALQSASETEPGKKPRNKWLSRLGLKDDS